MRLTLEPILNRLGLVGKAAAQERVNKAREDMRSDDTGSGPARSNKLLDVHDSDSRPGGLPYSVLRSYADICEPARLCINRIKSMMRELEWDIVPVDEDNENDAEIAESKEWFSQAGGVGRPGVMFAEFQDEILEDLLICGCFALYKRPSRGQAAGIAGSKLASIEAIDAATIIPKRTADGWIPEPPAAAYVQKLRSTGAEKPFTRDEISYYIWGSRTYSSYGRSFIEDCIMALMQWQAADVYNLLWFTEGDSVLGYWQFAGGGENSVTPQERKDFTAWLEKSKKKAQAKGRSVTDMVPPAGWSYHPFRPRSESDYIATQKFLMQRIAPFFGLTPSALGQESDTYKASQEAQNELAVRRSTKPLALYLNAAFTELLQGPLGLTTVQFQYDLEITDREQNARIARSLGTQFTTINDVQEIMGQPKFQGGYADDVFTVTAGGEVLVLASRDEKRAALVGYIETPEEKAAKEAAAAEAKTKQLEALQAGQAQNAPTAAPPGKQPPIPDEGKAAKATTEAARDDLRRWRDKANKARRAGQAVNVPFDSCAIPSDAQEDIHKALADGGHPTQVFSPYLRGGAEWREYLGRGLDGMIGELEQEAP